MYFAQRMQPALDAESDTCRMRGIAVHSEPPSGAWSATPLAQPPGMPTLAVIAARTQPARTTCSSVARTRTRPPRKGVSRKHEPAT